MKNNKFVNFTNHPHDRWDEKQLKAAQKYGEVVDVPFPNVDPSATREEILSLSDIYVKKIEELEPNAVLCQGEFTLCYNVVKKLKKKGYLVFSSTSNRVVVEKGNVKESIFEFVQFREY